MVERFNGRIGSEVLGITIYSHRNLEQLPRGFNAAYNVRRQRVLNGKTPDQIIAECLEARPNSQNPRARRRDAPAHVTSPRLASLRKPPRRSHNPVPGLRHTVQRA
jgi:hypothetical protein